jgi:hypothetical protein
VVLGGGYIGLEFSATLKPTSSLLILQSSTRLAMLTKGAKIVKDMLVVGFDTSANALELRDGGSGDMEWLWCWKPPWPLSTSAKYQPLHTVLA